MGEGKCDGQGTTGARGRDLGESARERASDQGVVRVGLQWMGCEV